MKSKLLRRVVVVLVLAFSVPVFAQTAGREYLLGESSVRDVSEKLIELLQNSQDRRLWGDYSSEKIELTFAGKPGMTIVIDHRFGDIDVVKGSNSSVKIDGEKRVSAQNKDIEEEFLREMRLIVDESEDRLRITAEYPEQRERRGRRNIRNFAIMYTIEVPENVTLEMENSFGDIELTDLKGDFNVRNTFGTLTADGLEGDVTLRNQFGMLDAEDITGTADISNEHGELIIDTVVGPLEADNQHGTVRVIDVTGNIDIRGGHGEMDIKRVTGDADIRNSFGAITCSDISGIVDIRNNNSKVEVYNADKDVTIQNSFGRIRAVEIGGNLDIKNNNSAVQVEDISGDIEINNSFGSVDILRAEGNIRVVNSNGGIDVRNILLNSGEAMSVLLETSFASIDIELPEDISARIDASTTFGNIRYDFDADEERTSINDKQVRTTLGAGTHQIILETKNGSINIRQR
ncbi:DUF4097 domain-containing protein [candidate division KSB1 bacterium]